MHFDQIFLESERIDRSLFLSFSFVSYFLALHALYIVPDMITATCRTKSRAKPARSDNGPTCVTTLPPREPSLLSRMGYLLRDYRRHQQLSPAE